MMSEKRAVYFSFVTRFVVCVFLSACSQGGSHPDGSTSVGVKMTIPKSALSQPVDSAAKPVGEDVKSIRIIVTDEGETVLATKIENVNPGQEVVIKMPVLAGPSRTFLVEAFSEIDARGFIRFKGEATQDLIAGVPATVPIEMVRVNITFQITPKKSIVAKEGRQTFTLTGIASGEVDWRVNGIVGGSETLGTINVSGVYTAPALIPLDTSETPLGVPLPIQIEAVSQSDPEAIDTAAVTVVTTEEDLIFAPTVKLSSTGAFGTSTRSTGQREIAFFNGTLYTVWEKDFEIFFSESTDGTTWSSPIPLSSAEGSQDHPAIAVGPNGSVYVVFEDCTNCSGSSTTTISLLEREIGERSFRQLPFGDTKGVTGFSSSDPSVAVASDGTVFVTWAAQPLGNHDIFLQRVKRPVGVEDDPSPRNLIVEDGDTQEQHEPVIAIASDGTVFLAWEDGPGLMATYSTNGGETFFSQIPLPERFELPAANAPSIAAGPPGTVYIVSESEECGEGCNVIAFDTGSIGLSGLVFDDGEETIGAPRNFFGPTRQLAPSIAWDGANGIYVAYMEQRFEEDTTIKIAKSITDGGGFNSLSFSGGPSGLDKSAPSLAVDSAGRVFTIWTDERGGTSRLRYVWFAQGE